MPPASESADGKPKPRPILWPALTKQEAIGEWNALREWVEQLRLRFPHAFRLPECWWRHNDLVEVLAALRDFERACYADDAAATGPVNWHRALRDMEVRVESWIKRFTCGASDRGHERIDWTEFVEADVARRRDKS